MNYEEIILVSLNLSSSSQSIRPSYLSKIPTSHLVHNTLSLSLWEQNDLVYSFIYVGRIVAPYEFLN